MLEIIDYITRENISSSAKLVLLRLVFRCVETFNDTSIVYYVTDIANDLGITGRTVIKALNELENLGYIQRHYVNFGEPNIIEVKLDIKECLSEAI